jgi:hypothetical protein
MVLSEGLSSRVTSSSVTSSRGSTSRELEQLIIESGSLTIQRVLHVSVHGVSWWLVSVPRQVKAGGYIEIRSSRALLYLGSSLLSGESAVRTECVLADCMRPHAADTSRPVGPSFALQPCHTKRQLPRVTRRNRSGSFSIDQSKLGNERLDSRTWWQEKFPSHIVSPSSSFHSPVDNIDHLLHSECRLSFRLRLLSSSLGVSH